ncbi:hypothetical protein TNCV_1718151 [Trichonephila clavipes]|nr:hypothetical protein TNCV_1718151 [Trichonephila clavipes]
MDGYTSFEMTPRICPTSRRLFPFHQIFIAHLLPKQFFYPSWKQSTEKGNTVRIQGLIDVKMGPLFRIPQIVWNLVRVGRRFRLTHVHYGSHEMKCAFNLDAFLGPTAVWKFITNFSLPHVFKRTRLVHTPESCVEVVFYPSHSPIHCTDTKRVKGQTDPESFPFPYETYKTCHVLP